MCTMCDFECPKTEIVGPEIILHIIIMYTLVQRTHTRAHTHTHTHIHCLTVLCEEDQCPQGHCLHSLVPLMGRERAAQQVHRTLLNYGLQQQLCRHYEFQGMYTKYAHARTHKHAYTPTHTHIDTHIRCLPCSHVPALARLLIAEQPVNCTPAWLQHRQWQWITVGMLNLLIFTTLYKLQ